MAKKLKINCGTCDARNLTEDTLAAYEAVTINCGDLIVSPETQSLLSRYGVAMNCGNTRCLPKDVTLVSVNGSRKITPADTVKGNIFLEVNGSLEIAPGCEKILESYVGMSVNGMVLCPESLGGCLYNVSVNGAVCLYPDDAVVLKRTAILDRLFALRAKDRLYWSDKRMVLVDPQLDGEKLAQKGARFQSKEIILAESLVDSLIDHIDERSNLVIVPDGTAVICDNVTLTSATLRQNGSMLYITGNLEITQDSREALEQITYLKVRGDATVPQEMQELLLEKAEIDGVLQVRDPFLGRRISEKNLLRISKWMLEQEEHGIWAEDCAIVKIDGDVTNELILSKLHLIECGAVKCAEDQESALAMVSEDCGVIGCGEENVLDQMGLASDPDTVTINAGDYVF